MSEVPLYHVHVLFHICVLFVFSTEMVEPAPFGNKLSIGLNEELTASWFSLHFRPPVQLIWSYIECGLIMEEYTWLVLKLREVLNR